MTKTRIIPHINTHLQRQTVIINLESLSLLIFQSLLPLLPVSSTFFTARVHCVFNIAQFSKLSLCKFRHATQTAEYVRFHRDLGGGKLKNLGAGVQKCTRGGLRGGLWAAMCYYIMCYYVMC